MAWIAIPGNSNWEYSNAPDTDKKSQDTYDYDTFSGHTAGIRAQDNGKVYVLSRQVTAPATPKENGGYGEIYMPD